MLTGKWRCSVEAFSVCMGVGDTPCSDVYVVVAVFMSLLRFNIMKLLPEEMAKNLPVSMQQGFRWLFEVHSKARIYSAYKPAPVQHKANTVTYISTGTFWKTAVSLVLQRGATRQENRCWICVGICDEGTEGSVEFPPSNSPHWVRQNEWLKK